MKDLRMDWTQTLTIILTLGVFMTALTAVLGHISKRDRKRIREDMKKRHEKFSRAYGPMGKSSSENS